MISSADLNRAREADAREQECQLLSDREANAVVEAPQAMERIRAVMDARVLLSEIQVRGHDGPHRAQHYHEAETSLSGQLRKYEIVLEAASVLEGIAHAFLLVLLFDAEECPRAFQTAESALGFVGAHREREALQIAQRLAICGWRPAGSARQDFFGSLAAQPLHQ